MKSAEHVSKQLEAWKKDGKPLMWIAWNIALLCVGWAYVFAALGEFCTPANRKIYYNSNPSHTTIKTKCQVICGGKSQKADCDGCKWYPGGEKTRIFDCRGFTRWILQVVYGWTLAGGGCTTQWNTKKNWKAKGKIATMPKDTLVCLFQYNPEKQNMKHTGFGYNNETVECQVGVQYSKKRSSKWTHWAIPACCAEDYVPPAEKPQAEKPKEDKVSSSKPTLKKGASGSNVKTLQKLLIAKGYSCGTKGADGKFGDSTLAAVKQFQKDNGLKADGIVGAKTWEALEKVPADSELYTVIITGQTKTSAQEICAKYKNATMKKEG